MFTVRPLVRGVRASRTLLPRVAVSNTAAITRNLVSAAVRAHQPTRYIAGAATSRARSYSVLSSSPEAKIYKYEDVKAIATNPAAHPETILIDVREPVEFNDGNIPGSINVPFKSSPGALDLSAEEFQENFGFDKPAADKELVFYCLGGVRSTAAEELANTFGYKKRGNYVGSWEDWVAHELKQ